MIVTTAFLLAASTATAYFSVKVFVVLSLTKLIKQKWSNDNVSCLIAGWIINQALQYGVILCLSVMGILNRPYFLAGWLLLAYFIYWRAKSFNFKFPNAEKLWQNKMPLIAICIVFLMMYLRSLFLTDYTTDAQVYGLPRLAIWLNRGSVLVHMSTVHLNLFVNEWNAELNSLAYALASGAYLGFAFGNLEFLFILFVTIYWLARLLGAPLFWALSLSAALGSAPVMLGLASTVKGDLLACIAFLMVLGWLIKIRQGESPLFAIGMLLLSATLAVGSKISVIPAVMALSVFAVVLIRRSYLREFWLVPALTKLGLFFGLMVFTSRFWVNWVVYGNPLKRVDGEQARFSFTHIIGNLRITADRLFGVWSESQGEGRMWALAGSMGWAGWLIVIVALLALVHVIGRLVGILTSYLRPPIEISAGRDYKSAEGFFAAEDAKISCTWLALVKSQELEL